MILRVVSAAVIGPTRLQLTFNDGVERTVNIAAVLEGQVFVPLHDPAFVAQGRLDPVCGTTVWPNAADYAAEALCAVTEPVQSLAAGGHSVTPAGGAG